MPRGFIRWETPPTNRAAAFALAAEAGALPPVDVPAGAEQLPRADQPTTIRDEVVFLLHTAAEIEHALLVQYLYAAYSLGDPEVRTVASQSVTPEQFTLLFGSGQTDGWQSTVVQVAKEEMGHLITVQNLLRLIGGPLNFEREDFPFRNEFYPFPFSLEPLTKDSLAKYVAAERPEHPDQSAYPKIAEIDLRALRSNRTLQINQVGRLYKQLVLLFNSLPESAFYPETVATLQATPNHWGKDEPTPTPRVIMAWSFGGTPKEAKAKAIRALDRIARQGEGATTGMTDSHFERFYRMYDQFPETNPRYGNPSWLPALPVPTHPSTAPYALPDEMEEAGRLTDDLARAWGHLFNLRYRMLLTNLAHYLQLDASRYPKSRGGLRKWALVEMRSFLPRISGRLTRLPRQSPNLFDRERAAVAGPPFELPYTLSLLDPEKARWGLHRDLVQAAGKLIARIRDDLGETDAAATALLQNMEEIDTAAVNETPQFEKETMDTQLPPAPPTPPPVPTVPPAPTAAATEADMVTLIEFLKAPPHNAANRHSGVDIGGGYTLTDLFADPQALLTHLKTQTVVQDDTEPAGTQLVVAGKPAESAFFRIIQRAGHPMKQRFAINVPVLGKTGVQIVEAWILSLI